MATAVAGCVVGAEDDDNLGGDGKADGAGTCAAPEYGDGTCHIDLACEMPDIDCYVTFETDAAAATWVDAAALGRGAPLPETDPRFAKGRKLLDAAWDIYKVQVPLGKLAETRIALVILDNPTSNAFVLPDADGLRGGHVITFHSKALDGTESDLELTGVLFHELKHLSGKHWLPDIEERINKYYAAPEGSEPIGARQANDARVKTHLEPYRKSELFVGPHVAESLQGLPYAGDLETLFRDMTSLLTSCATEVTSINAVYKSLEAATNPVDDSLAIDATTAAQLASSVMALSQCARTSNTMTLTQYLDSIGWLQFVMGELKNDEASYLAMPMLDGLFGLAAARRASQRDAQVKMQAEIGRPITAMRYFSYEEQADDTSVDMLKRAKLDAAGAASSWLGYLGDKQEQCVAAHAAGPVPYGVYLSDAHHGTCWRYAHHLQLAETPDSMAMQTSPIDLVRQPRVPRPAPVRRPIE